MGVRRTRLNTGRKPESGADQILGLIFIRVLVKRDEIVYLKVLYKIANV